MHIAGSLNNPAASDQLRAANPSCSLTNTFSVLNTLRLPFPWHSLPIIVYNEKSNSSFSAVQITTKPWIWMLRTGKQRGKFCMLINSWSWFPTPSHFQNTSEFQQFIAVALTYWNWLLCLLLAVQARHLPSHSLSPASPPPEAETH